MKGSSIAPGARIGSDVHIGDFTTIHENVVLGDGCTIGDHCVIGAPAGDAAPLQIGSGSNVRSHSVLYAGSTLGSGLETGHHVLIRAGTRAGEGLRVGSFSDIEGACEIGDFARLHSYAHVGRGSKIGHFVWLYSLTILTNDPLPFSKLHRPVVLEDGVVVAVGATLYPGAIMRLGSMAAARSMVKGEVPPGCIVSGDHQVRGHVTKLKDLESGWRHPWMRHSGDAYPEKAQERIRQLLESILATA